MASSKWRNIALMSAGTVALSCLIYYLKKNTLYQPLQDTDTTTEETIETNAEEEKANKALDIAKATKEDLKVLLNEIVDSQQHVKTVLKELIAYFQKEDFTFPQVYEKVNEVQLKDPLAEAQISLQELDEILNKYQQDPEISKIVVRVTGMSSTLPENIGKANTLDAPTILNIHKFILNEIKKVTTEFKELPNASEYNVKSVAIAIQVILGARIQKEFNVTSEELEFAIVLHHENLQANIEFANINLEIQSYISAVMGSQLYSS